MFPMTPIATALALFLCNGLGRTHGKRHYTEKFAGAGQGAAERV